jgi:hypothetical protein
MRRPKQAVSLKKLRTKLLFWQKKMDMSDWEISIEYADSHKVGKDSVAMIEVDERMDRIAKMFIWDQYYLTEHYNVRYNLDTVILHELAHAFMNEIMRPIPTKVRKRKYLSAFEEWLCDNFADIVYLNVMGKFAKKVKK